MSMQESQPYSLTTLPSDVLVMILEYLPLLDLANVRLVCSILQQTIDDKWYVHLWANAPLGLQWLSPQHRGIFERAATCGNFESLVKLAVAFLYSEGVPDGPGKGTASAINGVRATEYLRRAEVNSSQVQPFAWVLIRPPWASNNVCCKASVCYNLKKLCRDGACSEEEAFRLYYCIGKTLSFHEATGSERDEAFKWFEEGSQRQCPHCFHELWKGRHRLACDSDEVLNTRMLRKAATSGYPDIQLQLCEVYAEGLYGGIPQDQALQYIRHMVASSVPVMTSQIFKLQLDMTHTMRYILVDWLLEVAEMKEFPSATVHLAVSILDRYLVRRKIAKTQLQLLGITALVLASRWLDMTIITIREAAWLTDNTYSYEAVVRMMGEVIATLRGDLRQTTISDFLNIFIKLSGADHFVCSMACYLSECVLFHADFGQYSAAHIGAACVLLARILLRQEYPWPGTMVESTGLTLQDLRSCCLLVYTRCMTKQHCVTDHRNVKIHAVEDRFSASRFCGISNHQVMSYGDLKDHLGVITESPCKFPQPTSPEEPSLSSPLDDLASPLEDLASLPSSPEPEFPFEDCVAEEQLSSLQHSSVTSDTGSSREDSPSEISRSVCCTKMGSSWNSSAPLSADSGLLSDETLDDIMEVELSDGALRSRSMLGMHDYYSPFGPPRVGKGACSDRLHHSCPVHFPPPVQRASSPASSPTPDPSFSLTRESGVEMSTPRTVCPNASDKSKDSSERLRQPLKSLDNLLFVPVPAPAGAGAGKLSHSIQSLYVSRNSSPSITTP